VKISKKNIAWWIATAFLCALGNYVFGWS